MVEMCDYAAVVRCVQNLNNVSVGDHGRLEILYV